MEYYQIAVADAAYKGSKPLTYSYKGKLKVGQLVMVEVRRFLVIGVVITATKPPKFKTKLITTTLDLSPLPLPLLKLLNWLQNYYAAPLGVTMQQALPGSLTMRTAQQSGGQPLLPEPDGKLLPPLISEQQTAMDQLPQDGTSLLHGNTGTGKTRIYLEKAIAVIQSDRSVVILTPEISLTSQLLQSFKQVFGQRAIVTHSGLTVAERRKIWLQVLTSAEPLIVIGPRSALFTPLSNIGLIVIDEAHDSAYKHEGNPSYQAVHVGAKLASLHKAALIMGSATPAVNDYFALQQKQKPIFRLTKKPLLTTSHTTATDIIDMRNRSNFTQNPYISDLLLAKMRSNLASGQQTLLFLNRRGSARLVLCKSCGWHALCSHCGTPMTFHEDSFSLRCHTCNRRQDVPKHCPDCKAADILFKSIGTKAVETTIKQLLSGAKVMRFDTDNKKAERLDKHYQAIKDGEVNIIIGTQLLAKGLDLPKLSLVGVLNADLSLQIPDFTAEEKTYQLLSQVVGRVGRGHGNARVVLQTYNPTNPVISGALSGNWTDFYNHELSERRDFMFPPFCHLLSLTVRRAKSATAEKAALDLMTKLQHNAYVTAEGPIPSYQKRVDGKFQWKLIIKSKSRKSLLDIVANLPSGWHYDLDPINLL